MAKRTYVTVTLRDANGKNTRRQYEARDAAVTDGDVVDLVTDLQALTKLSVVDASVSRNIDISAVTTEPEVGSTRVKKYDVRYTKSLLRDSSGGVYTFSIPDLKDDLVQSNASIDTSRAEFDDWRENFDDGAGIAGVQGNFFISDLEELVEDEEVLGGELTG